MTQTRAVHYYLLTCRVIFGCVFLLLLGFCFLRAIRLIERHLAWTTWWHHYHVSVVQSVFRLGPIVLYRQRIGVQPENRKNIIIILLYYNNNNNKRGLLSKWSLSCVPFKCMYVFHPFRRKLFFQLFNFNLVVIWKQSVQRLKPTVYRGNILH